jgi:hypothetical protein
MLPPLYFILFLWSIISFLYALIKRDETAIEVFIILIAFLYITLSNIMKSDYMIYSPLIIRIFHYEFN